MRQKRKWKFFDYVYSYLKFCQEDFYPEHYTAQETWTQSKCKWRPLLESIAFKQNKNNRTYRRQIRTKRKEEKSVRDLDSTVPLWIVLMHFACGDAAQAVNRCPLLTGLSSRWSQSLRWFTSANASGMLSPSEQKSSSTASGISCAQLKKNNNKKKWMSAPPFNRGFKKKSLGAPVSDVVHVPVCVEAFGYASPRDAETRLRTGVSQPWESGHLLHLPPAELL